MHVIEGRVFFSYNIVRKFFEGKNTKLDLAFDSSCKVDILL